MVAMADAQVLAPGPATATPVGVGVRSTAGGAAGVTVKFETVARRAGHDVRRARGWLAFESSAITFTLLPQWQCTILAQWDDVEAITFDDPGRTKADVGMIAVFGVAGMA